MQRELRETQTNIFSTARAIKLHELTVKKLYVSLYCQIQILFTLHFSMCTVISTKLFIISSVEVLSLRVTKNITLMSAEWE